MLTNGQRWRREKRRTRENLRYYDNARLSGGAGAGSERSVVAKNTKVGQVDLPDDCGELQFWSGGREEMGEEGLRGDERAMEVKWLEVRGRTDVKRGDEHMHIKGQVFN